MILHNDTDATGASTGEEDDEEEDSWDATPDVMMFGDGGNPGILADGGLMAARLAAEDAAAWRQLLQSAQMEGFEEDEDFDFGSDGGD